MLAACSTPDDLEGAAPREGGEVELPGGRMARIHVTLMPTPDPAVIDPQLDLRARFAAYRGLDDDFVRARLGLGPLPGARIGVGSCMLADLLDATVDASEARPASGDHELLLLDGGNLLARLGDLDLEVPLVLVPDLLPYMSGVEYELQLGALPSVFVADERSQLVLEFAGSGDEELPPLRLEARLPPPIDLRTEPTLDPSLIDLSWRAVGQGALLLRFAATQGGELLGDEIACAVVDRGATRFDLDELRRLGLGLGGTNDGLRITATRTAATTFESGEFIGGELIVDLRESVFVTTP